MKKLTILVAALSLFASGAVAFAGNANCPHLPKDCTAAPHGNAASNLSMGEMMR